jgi:subtilisin family serine protease
MTEMVGEIVRSHAVTPRIDSGDAITTGVVEQELAARGVAQVLVVMKAREAPAAAMGAAGARFALQQPVADSLTAHFTSSELSLPSQIAAGSGRVLAGAASALTAAATSSGHVPAVRFFPNLGVMLGTVDRQGFNALVNDDRVSSVTGTPQISPIWPDRIAAAKLTAAIPWGLEMLEIPQLWKQGLTGKNIKVGHLDTGVDGTHPTFKAAISAFAEFDNLGFQKERGKNSAPYDTGEHGTHTAGTILGRAVNGRAVGVAREALLVSAIVIEGGDAVARVIAGMDWCLANGISVLSMSLGFRGWWESFLPLTAVLRSKNILPVIAVGNEGAGTSRSPGNYQNVVSVGAADERRRVAGFSSSQRFRRNDDPVVPDMLAPGVGIVSAKPRGGYQEMDGTSMATPHIAGLAALLFEAKPTATSEEVERALYGSCHLARGMDSERCNRGIPSGLLALELLTGVHVATSRRKSTATAKPPATKPKKASSKNKKKKRAKSVTRRPAKTSRSRTKSSTKKRPVKRRD